MTILTWNGVPLAEEEPKDASVAVLGLASSLGATTRGKGNELAPEAVRRAYRCVSPWREGAVVDLGDNVGEPIESPITYANSVQEDVATVLQNDLKLACIGGDDSVAYGVVRGVAQHLGRPVRVMHYDAHSDTGTPYYDDNMEIIDFDHASWVQALIETGDVEVIGQIGVRTPGDTSLSNKTIVQPDVVVIDMDYFDPSCAPGVSVPEPFGPSSSAGLATLQRSLLDKTVTSLVVTEVNPLRDANELTARLAFRLMYEFVRRNAQ